MYFNLSFNLKEQWLSVRENHPGDGNVPTVDCPSDSERSISLLQLQWSNNRRKAAEQKGLSEVCSCFLVGRTNMDSQFLGLKRFKNVLRLSHGWGPSLDFKSDCLLSAGNLLLIFSAQLRQQACFQKALCLRWVVRFNEARRVGGKTRF